MTKQFTSLSRLIASLTLVMMAGAGFAHAQDNYVPPPMFDAPAMNAQPGENIMRRFSPRHSPSQQPQPAPNATPPEQRYTGENNPLLPPVVTQGDPALQKPNPVVTPKTPNAPKKTQTVKAPIPVSKPQIARPATPAPDTPVAAAPATPPIQKPQVPVVAKKPAAPSVSEPTAMPAARVTSKGVVTGPKTMPSVPTGSVVAETTFNEHAAGEDEPTLMERHHAAIQEDSPPPVAAPMPAPVIDTARTTPANKLSIPFTQGIDTAQDLPIEGIVSALQADPSYRLMIEAYATSTDAGENSDRRLSLARAMAVRKALMDDGIAPYRIDIRALGRHVPNGSPDRVDLSVYKG